MGGLNPFCLGAVIIFVDIPHYVAPLLLEGDRYVAYFYLRLWCLLNVFHAGGLFFFEMGN